MSLLNHFQDLKIDLFHHLLLLVIKITFYLLLCLVSSINIPYRKINLLSPLVQDYLSESPELSSFYGRYNTLDNFHNQMEEKVNSY